MMTGPWLAVAATLAILLVYELVLALWQRRHGVRLAKTTHARLRRAWFETVSEQAGTELLAVQTVRNAVMAATMSASIAALGLMGTATLATPALHDSVKDGWTLARLGPGQVMELILMAMLFASLLASLMAVRFYKHCSFVCAMPVQSAARRRWQAIGVEHIQRAGIFYSWGVKYLVLVAPVLVSLLQPLAGPPVALVVVAALWGFDRIAVYPSGGAGSAD